MKLNAEATSNLPDGTRYKYRLSAKIPDRTNIEQMELTARTLINLVSQKLEDDCDVDDDGDPLIPTE
jgi:hypothetical protein